jgi:hypothetical protein
MKVCVKKGVRGVQLTVAESLRFINDNGRWLKRLCDREEKRLDACESKRLKTELKKDAIRTMHQIEKWAKDYSYEFGIRMLRGGR